MVASRFVFYSHEGLIRDLAIAVALTEADPEVSVLLVTVRVELGARSLPSGVDVVALPGDRALREAEMSAILESFRPDVLLVDEPSLGSLPRWDGRTALGLLDVLEPPADEVIALMQERCERLLVYGNSGAIDLALPDPLVTRVRYCGYVVGGAPPAWNGARIAPSPRVFACADAGADGRALIDEFVKAACGARWDAVVVARPDARPVDRAVLRQIASAAGLECFAPTPELSLWMAPFDVLVCTGAYDTLSEALWRGTPTVCVPRAHPRTDQLIRARMFADLGLLRLVEPWRVSAGRLIGEVTEMLGADRREIAARAHASLGFDGARMAARELLELAEHPLGLRDREWLSSG